MDEKELLSKLEGKSDEEVLAFFSQALKAAETTDKEPGLDKPDEKKSKVSVVLPDGSTLEAESSEELNKELTRRLHDVSNAEPREKPVEPRKRPEWDLDKYGKTFVTDPRSAHKYMDESQMGFSSTEVLPVMVAGMAQLARQVEELRVENARASVKDENRPVLDSILKDRGWQPTKQNYADAYAIAKGNGLLKEDADAYAVARGNATKKEENKPFIAPRISGVKNTDESALDLMNKAYDMPYDKLENFLMEQGIINNRRASDF